MAARPRKAKQRTRRSRLASRRNTHIGVIDFNPQEVAKAARRVYESQRADLEKRHPGKYVLIDTQAERLFLAESPGAAYRQAAAEHADGPYHLIRIGERAAFRSRRLLSGGAPRLAG
jgi:hypothetical protein